MQFPRSGDTINPGMLEQQGENGDSSALLFTKFFIHIQISNQVKISKYLKTKAFHQAQGFMENSLSIMEIQ